MKIVLITHPQTLDSTSMPRFARMIHDGMSRRGHDVRCWTSPCLFGRFFSGKPGLNKWASYVDQYLIYPPLLKAAVAAEPRETLFVVTDQALGPWVPSIARRPHVIHCHDFLAQRSAIGEIPENRTGWSGKKYQQLIRRGYRRGQHFISVSGQTEADLKRLMRRPPATSRVVHNGLNGNFRILNESEAERVLGNLITPEDRGGVLLHVGGNQWYKNRMGVVDLYAAYRKRAPKPLPLWMVGQPPSAELREKAHLIGGIRFLEGLTDEQVIAAYNIASMLLFPSLAEGFGWPIAEAMACGTPVLTTNQAPMNEVGAEAAIYLSTDLENNTDAWAADGAEKMIDFLSSHQNEKERIRMFCLDRAKCFAPEAALDAYERVYAEVLSMSTGSVPDSSEVGVARD